MPRASRKHTKLTPNVLVRLHPATDEWMQGDRIGLATHTRSDGAIRVLLDRSKRAKWFHPGNVQLLP